MTSAHEAATQNSRTIAQDMDRYIKGIVGTTTPSHEVTAQMAIYQARSLNAIGQAIVGIADILASQTRPQCPAVNTNYTGTHDGRCVLAPSHDDLHVDDTARCF